MLTTVVTMVAMKVMDQLEAVAGLQYLVKK